MENNDRLKHDLLELFTNPQSKSSIHRGGSPDFRHLSRQQGPG